MKLKTRFITLSLLILSAAAIASGCAPTRPASRQPDEQVDKFCANCTTFQPKAPTAPAASPTPIATPPVSPSAGGDGPIIETVIRGTGYTTATFSVRARRILKLRFRPGMQDRTVAGTGFVPNYSRMGVYIKVGSLEQPTPMLSNGFAAAPAKESPILDFSSAIPACSSSAATCRTSVTITIQRPNYDYWCLNYGMYCSWTRVHDTHPWNGTLLIQTDDTEELQ